MSEKAIWEFLKTLNTEVHYIDVSSGDFVLGTGVEAQNIWANIGSETAGLVFQDITIKSQLAANASLKICDIAAGAKQLLGGTYVLFPLVVKGSGKCVIAAFNTYGNFSEITFQNTTGSALAADTELVGSLTIVITP